MDMVDVSAYAAVGFGIATFLMVIAYYLFKITGKAEYQTFFKDEIFDILFVALLWITVAVVSPMTDYAVREIDPQGYLACLHYKQISSSPISTHRNIFLPFIPPEIDCYLGVPIVFLRSLTL